jgi:hypothetical protein
MYSKAVNERWTLLNFINNKRQNFEENFASSSRRNIINLCRFSMLFCVSEGVHADTILESTETGTVTAVSKSLRIPVIKWV